MIVASITAVNRLRSRVCLEEAADPAFSSFVLGNRDIVSLDLREGSDVSPDTFAQIRSALRAACLLKCGALLGSRDYTRRRLIAKLCEAGFPRPVAEDAADAMEEAHYLDDKRFAQTYVAGHIGDRSLTRIRQDLKLRGVSEEDIGEAFLAADAEAADRQGSLADAEEAQIRAFLKKKRFDPETASFGDRQRLMAALYRRGYAQETIRRVMGGGEQ